MHQLCGVRGVCGILEVDCMGVKGTIGVLGIFECGVLTGVYKVSFSGRKIIFSVCMMLIWLKKANSVLLEGKSPANHWLVRMTCPFHSLLNSKHVRVMLFGWVGYTARELADNT